MIQILYHNIITTRHYKIFGGERERGVILLEICLMGGVHILYYQIRPYM
jgi:hypothetical protein